ncbi:hypothetical protein CDG76_12495 [Nostoc sp. 'Peltigera membranacea cyanobiont' 210A]|uniref:hypothetical protein n=1 Tax=Nostoc sp. 'Peltigera membranacea cyanobiont' 210A TaxID=2014529 RepID=UPI000B9573C2|nr:hypothetical protein [Nostoc sp. 'Peltigera membranacea cyanobiont' 210A]OYD95744.1 hypothetical protein CDG76_12495 [Nostoc sp. 'Peltigera membranacea cyanobiont' 210A]
MSNITSTASATVVAQEQHFTNLTPEEASVIEGGYTLNVYSLVCAADGADPWYKGKDDVYAKVTLDGITTNYGVGDMGTGDAKNLLWEFNFFENAEISFFDSDWPDSDDPLGSISVSGLTNGLQKPTIRGSGSRYKVFYDVTA